MTNFVTLEQIQSKIKGEMYMVLPDGRTTLCMLTMKNGYTVKGMSACVDASNFDINVGRKIAFDDAIKQIWPLEGYLLAERLSNNQLPDAGKPEVKHDWHAARVEGEIVATRRKRKAVEAPWGYKKDGTPKQRPGRKVAA